MPLNSYIQRPTEQKVYSIDYSNWLDSTLPETLVSHSVTIMDNTATTPLVTNSSLDIINGIVTFSVSGGEDDTQYHISIQVTTSTPQTKDDCVAITVKSDCV